MIPVIIGAALGVAAYKFLDAKHEKNSHEKIWTRYLSEEEVPPEILKEVELKRRARFAKEKNSRCADGLKNFSGGIR